MVIRDEATTCGCVYTDLNAQAWEILYRFEDPVFHSDRIEVHRPESSKLSAYVYVLSVDQQHRLFSGIWLMNWFVDVQLDGYVSRCRLFSESITSEEPSSLLLARLSMCLRGAASKCRGT